MNYSFFTGALAFPLLELCWRGRTHPSMAVAGGVSLSAIGRINKRIKGVIPRGIAGGCAITAVELAMGLALNKDHRIWDYSHLPCNLSGQICLKYSALWAVLCAGLAILDR